MRTTSICHIFIVFQRCIEIHINIYSLPVRSGAPPSLYPFFLQCCIHILSKVFRSETAYSRSEVNQMWILKNSNELLEHLKSTNFNHITSIKSFDFSTIYTTIPHLIVSRDSVSPFVLHLSSLTERRSTAYIGGCL